MDLQPQVRLGVFPDDTEEGPLNRMIFVVGGAGGKSVPLHGVDAGEQLIEREQVELKRDGACLTIVSATDQFGLAEVHGDFPTFWTGSALKANTADIDEWLEQLRDSIDKVGEPGRTSGARLAVFGRFDLPDQVLQGEMRMTHVERRLQKRVVYDDKAAGKASLHHVSENGGGALIAIGVERASAGFPFAVTREMPPLRVLTHRDDDARGDSRDDDDAPPNPGSLLQLTPPSLPLKSRVSAFAELLFPPSGAVVNVEEATRKANVLIEATRWIRRFRDRLVVIKLGGSALEDPEVVRNLLADVVFMETVGLRLVLIHGGGKSISAAMNKSGIEPRWVQGRRYTDPATLDIVTRVLAEEICGDLVRQINAAGGQAVGLSYLTENVLLGEKLFLADDHGVPLDLGFVGQVVEVNRELLLKTIDSGKIPVIPSVAVDWAGQRYNVNADTAAAAVARSLDAEKLIFLSDVSGILRDRTDPTSLVSNLTEAECRGLIADGTIHSGMVPKVDAALDALRAGVKKVHIVDGRMPHSLLLEIFSDQGIGTEIVP